MRALQEGLQGRLSWCHGVQNLPKIQEHLDLVVDVMEMTSARGWLLETESDIFEDVLEQASPVATCSDVE